MVSFSIEKWVDFAKFGPEKIEIDQNTIVYSTDG